MTNSIEPTQPTALPYLRVLEVASLIPGPYCGKLLASLGANVIKAEPLAGDPSRRRGPFPDDIPHPERSGLYLYLNTGKQSVTLNLDDAAGRDLLRQLVAGVDMVVHDYTPERAAVVGLDGDALQAANPDVIVTAITPFARPGPTPTTRPTPDDLPRRRRGLAAAQRRGAGHVSGPSAHHRRREHG